MKGRIKTPIEKDFIRFVMENCGCPDGGTATSYETALYVLNLALEKSRPSYVAKYNIWDIEDPKEINKLYKIVLKEQRNFIKSKTGLFAAIHSAEMGSSYYEKRWCSAALRFLERFRSATHIEQRYESTLTSALGTIDDPVLAAHKASKVILKGQKLFLPKGISPATKRGREIIRGVRLRCNQNVFRRAILNNYQHCCCVCGIAQERLLEAAHIQEWSADLSNALNATNGMCLSATYHRAYDAHLMEVDSSYVIHFSSVIKECCTKEVYARCFAPYDGKKIVLPIRYSPDRKALERHCEGFVA